MITFLPQGGATKLWSLAMWGILMKIWLCPIKKKKKYARTYTRTRTHTHAGGDLQQRHLDDQVNQVGQQLLQEILAVRLCMKRLRGVITRHTRGGSLLIKVTASLLPSTPSTTHSNSLLHPYFIVTVGTERHWWKLANYWVSAGVQRVHIVTLRHF